MTSKLLANRIKRILSPHISLEKFGFLSNMRLQDVVTISQETFHSMKTRKLNSCLMKIDLIQVYGSVDWDFLIMILYKLCFPHIHVCWIKACFSSATMALNPHISSKYIGGFPKVLYILDLSLYWL